MPPWLPLTDPFLAPVVAAAVAIIILTILIRLLQRRRAVAAEERRRAELQRTRGEKQEQQRAADELAAQIVATGSTAIIAGYEVVRQIEAVFAEGQRSPAEAVEALKILAATKGANAIINLNGQRLPNGKCVASGDAVLVRPLMTFESDASVPRVKRRNGEPRLDGRWD